VTVEPTSVLQHKLFELGGKAVSIATLCVVVGIVIGGWLLSRVVNFVVHRAFVRRGVGKRRSTQTFERLIRLTITIVSFIVALQTVGIDLGAVVAAGAVFAVGIGLAMQSVAMNFVSGIVLLLERSIKIDDILEIDGHICRVMEMGIRSTRVRTLFEEDIILPNSVLVQQPIKNLTLHDSLIRIAVLVGVAYDADLDRVRAALERVPAAVEDIDPAYPPLVLLHDLAASNVVYEVSLWTHDPWKHRKVRSMMREAILNELRAERIPIAFPQLDVHFDAGVNDAFARLGKAA